MKFSTPTGRYARCIMAGLTTTLLALPAPAESEPDPQTGKTFPSDRSANCSLARDPVRCLAMQQAREPCQADKGMARRRCLQEKMPAPDCAKAPDPGRCRARQQARLACQGTSGKALRKCLRQVDTPPISSIN